MPFVVGFLLLPFVALIGAGLALAFLSVFYWPPLGVRWHVEVVAMVAVFAALFAAPVTLGALPLGYLLLSRFAALSRQRLALIGMLGAVLSIAAFVLEETMRLGPDPGFVRGMSLVGLLGGTAGLAIGLIFAIIMRRLRPEEWRAKGTPV